MITFILNSTNLLQDKKGTVGHHAVVACAEEVTEETIQKIKGMIKERFGLTLNVMTGKTSDPDTFLSIENVDILD